MTLLFFSESANFEDGTHDSEHLLHKSIQDFSSYTHAYFLNHCLTRGIGNQSITSTTSMKEEKNSIMKVRIIPKACLSNY